MRKLWTDEDITFLKENVRSYGNESLRKTLGRSADAIRRKCLREGLSWNSDPTVEDDNGMTITHRPKRIIPEETVVKFDFMNFNHLLKENGFRNWDLRDDVKAWLDPFPYDVEFDCGDWGEGMPVVTLTFDKQSAAKTFTAQWGKKK